MLSDLDIKHRLEINLSALGPATPAVFPLTELGSPEFPWQFKDVSGLVTTAGLIAIITIEVRDENSNLVSTVSLIPWIFANTVTLVNANQTPEPVGISFFGTNISGVIPSDLYVFSNWSLSIGMLNPAAGASFDFTGIFMQGYFGDKYRLST